jgi:hypothetical protein
MAQGPVPSAPLYKQILLLVMLIALLTIGVALILRSLLSIRSRVGKLLDHHVSPLLLGLVSGDSVGIALVVLLPAILLMLLLRGLGIRGQVAGWCRSAGQKV